MVIDIKNEMRAVVSLCMSHHPQNVIITVFDSLTTSQ